MKAIILAGGKGKKLFPYTKYHQKCTLPIANTSNIKRIVMQIQKESISDITVLLDYREQDVIAELEGFDVHTIMVNDASFIDVLSNECEKDTLIYYGDIVITQEDLHSLLQSYCEHGTSALVQPLSNEWRTQDYICADVQNHQIKTIYGHPRGTYANARMMGVYAISNDVAKAIRYTRYGFDKVNCGQMCDNAYHFENTLQKSLEKQPIQACFIEHGFDLDFPWDLFAANAWMSQQLCEALTQDEIDETATISERAIIRGYVKVGANSHIGDGVIIKGNCIIEDHVRIEDGAIIYANCIVGKGSVVCDGCKINENTVIGPYNKIGYLAEIGGLTMEGVAQVHNSEVYGIVGKYVDIAAGVVCGILKFDDLQVSSKVLGKRYQNKNTNIVCIGDYTRTGVCNVFYPGVKVGSHCALGPNLVIDKDVLDNTLLMPKQEVEMKSWGSEKYGW